MGRAASGSLGKIRWMWSIMFRPRIADTTFNLSYWDQSFNSKDDSGSPDSSTVQDFFLATSSSDSLLIIFRPPFPEDKIKWVWGVRLSLQTCDKPRKVILSHQHFLEEHMSYVLQGAKEHSTTKQNTYLVFVSLALLPSCRLYGLEYEKGSSVSLMMSTINLPSVKLHSTQM